LLLALGATLYGCIEETPPQVLLGAGSWQWEPLSGGDRIPIIQGPQGGFHLLGSLRAVGLDAGDHTDLDNPSNPTTTFSVWFDGRNYTPNASFTQGIRPAPTDAPEWSHEMIGRFAILDIEADDELDEAALEFSVTVEDVDGRRATDSLQVTAYIYEFNQ
jgi:hypothetical protein